MFGLEDVTSLANGFTMFRFKTEDDLQKVIENGPWMFGGKAIILEKWHSGFVFDMNNPFCKIFAAVFFYEK